MAKVLFVAFVDDVVDVDVVVVFVFVFFGLAC